MQALLLNKNQEALWFKAALRECIQYGEHGEFVEETDDGHEVCFNCGNDL